MVKILAFDTCNSLCSVSLIDNGKIIEYKCSEKLSKQAEQLLPLIESVLSTHNLNYNNLGALALTIGPGSFTGIRIGIAAAQGIRLASNIPIIPIDCFEVIALNIKNGNEIIVILDARRNQLYLQKFSLVSSIIEPLGAASLVSYEQAIDTIANGSIVAGSGLCLIQDLLCQSKPQCKLDNHFEIIDSNMVGLAAWYKYSKKLDFQKLSPLYIRPSDAKLPSN